MVMLPVDKTEFLVHALLGAQVITLSEGEKGERRLLLCMVYATY